MHRAPFSRIFAWAVCVLAIAPLLGVLRADPPVQPDRGEVQGQALAAKLRDDLPREDIDTQGVLRITHPDGHRSQVPVQMVVRTGNPSWQSTYRAFAWGTAPQPATATAMRPTEIEELTVVHTVNGPNDYLWSRAEGTTTLGKPALLHGDQADQPFAHSDFWLSDLGLEFFHWSAQRIVKHEMRKSRSCRVLESMNPHPAKGAYSRVLSWIDYETSGLVRAEAYDAAGTLLKVFEVKKIAKVNGKTQLKAIEIRNTQTDSRTLLEFDYELK